MTAHTRTEIANNWTLWQEYVDPSATMTRDEFDAMPLAEKLQIQVDCFGPEEAAIELGTLLRWPAPQGTGHGWFADGTFA